ncbi:MAG TPA: hypothetical protein VFN76_10685 [Candidatus Limnocylindria bacterium]|nr:hypothetical protein [Candidatus Limnocylindria bacterium]
MSETPAPSATTSFVTIVVFVIGGAAVGLAIAYGVAGGTPVAALVGFMALPVAFGAALAAWRAVLVAWLAAGIGRAALRSRASGESFTSELIGSIRGNPDHPRTALPGTWVFLPVTGAIGLVAALVMAIAAASNGLLAGTMLFVAAVGIGWLMRRLALDGRLLPIQE